MTVCIVDTSILVELLDVPGKVSHRAQVLSDFEQLSSTVPVRGSLTS